MERLVSFQRIRWGSIKTLDIKCNYLGVPIHTSTIALYAKLGVGGSVSSLLRFLLLGVSCNTRMPPFHVVRER